MFFAQISGAAGLVFQEWGMSRNVAKFSGLAMAFPERRYVRVPPLQGSECGRHRIVFVWLNCSWKSAARAVGKWRRGEDTELLKGWTYLSIPLCRGPGMLPLWTTLNGRGFLSCVTALNTSRISSVSGSVMGIQMCKSHCGLITGLGVGRDSYL